MQAVSSDPAYEKRHARLLLDVLIRAGLILALVMLCFQVFSPFLVLMIWALILAVTLYPLHQSLAARMGGRQGWAATLIMLLGVALIVVPTAVLMNSLGDSVHGLIHDVQQNTLRDSAAASGRRRMAGGRREGPRLLATGARPTCRRWSRACSRRSATWPRRRWRSWPASAASMLQFVASFIVAGIMMAFGEAGASRQPGDLRAHLRPRTRRRVHRTCRWRRSAPSPRA